MYGQEKLVCCDLAATSREQGQTTAAFEAEFLEPLGAEVTVVKKQKLTWEVSRSG